MMGIRCASFALSFALPLAAMAQFGAPTGTGVTTGFGTSAVADDFDNDGIAEVVVTCNGGGFDGIELFENDGTGTLTSQGQVAAVGGANSGAGPDNFSYSDLGDFDGDGDLDIVVSFGGATGDDAEGVVIFLNTSPLGGPITFAADAFYDATNIDPGKLEVGDFNGDGFPDVAVGNFDFTPDPNVAIYLNTGTGVTPFLGASANEALGSTDHIPCDVCTGDWDGDGDVDLGIAGLDIIAFTAPGLFVMLNDGTGNFAVTGASPVAPNAGVGLPYECVAENFDGGGLDIAVQLLENPLAVGDHFMDCYSGDGAGGFAPFAGGPFNPAGETNLTLNTSFEAMDYDQDGNVDVVGSVPGSSVLRNWLSDGAGGFPTTATDAAGTTPIHFVCVDLDGDDVPDGVACDAIGPPGQILAYINAAAPIAPLGITSATPMPAGTVGTPYAQTATAGGGQLPYTWRLAAGTLPTGLALNMNTGAITGTPTTAGAFAFTLEVVDHCVAIDQQATSITIAAAGGGGGGGGGPGINTRGGSHGGSTNLLCSCSGAAGGASGAWLWPLLFVAVAAVLRRGARAS